VREGIGQSLLFITKWTDRTPTKSSFNCNLVVARSKLCTINRTIESLEGVPKKEVLGRTQSFCRKHLDLRIVLGDLGKTIRVRCSSQVHDPALRTRLHESIKLGECNKICELGPCPTKVIDEDDSVNLLRCRGQGLRPLHPAFIQMERPGEKAQHVSAAFGGRLVQSNHRA
jgi:hypothetical protein